MVGVRAVVVAYDMACAVVSVGKDDRHPGAPRPSSAVPWRIHLYAGGLPVIPTGPKLGDEPLLAGVVNRAGRQ